MKTIVLISDFGTESPYVGEMKGAILSINSNVRIVDGAHNVPAQDIAHGAFVLRQLSFAFPKETVFVTVVDPGVGTERNILLVENQKRFFIAPDNGILSHLFDEGTVRLVDKKTYWRDNVSSTFHGRDIMGPVAAHLSNGIAAASVSSPLTKTPRLLKTDEPQIGESEIVGQVIFVDSFGNLITNLSSKFLGDDIENQSVVFANQTLPITTTYGNDAGRTPIALIGSNGNLEIAVVNGNAEKHFAASVGDSVRFCRED